MDGRSKTKRDIRQKIETNDLEVDGDIRFSGNLYQNGSLFSGGGGGGSSTTWVDTPTAIYNTKNVGIKNTNPTFPLDVVGDINLTGDIYQNGSLLSLGGGGSSIWSQNGVDAYYTTGKVGIGKTTPTESLDVSGNASVSGNSTTNGILTVGDQINLTNSTVKLLNDANALSLYTGSLERMKITSTGNVGIGKSPAYPLDVNGDINLTGDIYQNGTLLSLGGGGGGSGAFTDSGSSAYYMGGNVGIGTTSPTKKLNINSSTNLDGLLIDVNNVQGEIQVKAGTSRISYTSLKHISSTSTYASQFSLGLVYEPNLSLFEFLRVIRNGSSTGNMYIGYGTDICKLLVSDKLGVKNTNPTYDLDITGDINYTGVLYNNGTPVSFGGGGSGGSVWTGIGVSPNANIYYTDGNVWIGTFSPADTTQPLFIESSTNNVGMTIKNTVGSGTVPIRLESGNSYAKIFHKSGATYANYLKFSLYHTANNNELEGIRIQRDGGSSLGTVYIGSTNDNVGLQVYGDLTYTGTLTGPSDGRFKKNQQVLNYEHCFNKIKSIELKTYDWDIEKLREYNKNSKTDEDGNISISIKDPNNKIGFIAQEVESVMPDAVNTRKMFNVEDFKSVDYGKIQLHLFGAVKHLIKENETMKEELALLKEKYVTLLLNK